MLFWGSSVGVVVIGDDFGGSCRYDCTLQMRSHNWIMNSRYPPNWKAIADQIKAEALGRCQRCGWVCDGSSRDQVLQVHHWDMKPENNTRSNLVALCPRCHLELHSGGRGNVSEGQMGLLGEV